MFTINTPILDREAKILASVQSFNQNISNKVCSDVLDELFFEWVGSESSSDTTSEYRSKVAYAYREMKALLASLEKNSVQEIDN